MRWLVLHAAFLLILVSCNQAAGLSSSSPDLWLAGAGSQDAGAPVTLMVASVCLQADVDPAVTRTSRTAMVDRIAAEKPTVRLIVFWKKSLSVGIAWRFGRSAFPGG